MKIKIKIPATCDECRFSRDILFRLRCILFLETVEDGKCPQCLAKPEIEIEFEE